MVESDGWDDDADNTPAPSIPIPNLSTTRAKPTPFKPAPPKPAVVESDGWDAPVPDSFTSAAEDKGSIGGGVSLVGLSKEDKDKEMARRREERKAVSTGVAPLEGWAWLILVLCDMNRGLRL